MKAHEEDIYDETWRVEGTGEPFWHWHVRGVKHMNDYLEEVMHVGNSMGKKLTKKLEGDARKYFFGGVMVRPYQQSSFTTLHSYTFMPECIRLHACSQQT